MHGTHPLLCWISLDLFTVVGLVFLLERGNHSTWKHALGDQLFLVQIDWVVHEVPTRSQFLIVSEHHLLGLDEDALLLS